MRRTIATLSAIAMTLGISLTADARPCRRMTKTEGAVVGAVAGGILGNVIAGRGNRTAGTLVGATAGGVAGHEIARTRYRRCRNRG